jgi:small subunit ribosomal protein S21
MIIIKSNEMVEGGEIMARINVDDNENLEKAIKRFKRMIEKEGIIREYKKREYYEKPSTIQNRKNKTLQRKLSKKYKKHMTQVNLVINF